MRLIKSPWLRIPSLFHISQQRVLLLVDNVWPMTGNLVLYEVAELQRRGEGQEGRSRSLTELKAQVGPMWKILPAEAVDLDTHHPV